MADTENTTGSTESDEAAPSYTEAPDSPENPPEAESVPENTFSREYVKELREESKGHRLRADAAEGRADELAKRLHAALVAATGRLADPADLPVRSRALRRHRSAHIRD
ncbi:hypothetical protein [Mycobacterium riyadhense]|uniref:hypothetical protein n=1 Tax=Mycobacterium riyadhense TaxID=486698 RepID=UPI00209583E6|nr:hypothetical protein [Mycobacterium riyadhense]